MDTVLSLNQLREIYGSSTCLVTEQTSGIRLEPRDVQLDGDVCTLYTSFDKNVHSGLAMYADSRLFHRLTQRMMRAEEVNAQDVEDFSKEYFNVLCGHIAVALFRDTKVAARFQIPAFHRGWYRPKEQEERMRLDFLSDGNEGIRLIHYKAPAS